MQQFPEQSRLWLEQEYLSRKQKNAQYSLRAFARLLDLPSGRVSQLLAEKRRLTPALGLQIARRLNYDPQKTQELLARIVAEKKSQKTEAVPALVNYKRLDMDQFVSIADPIHFSLLSLVETKEFSEAHAHQRLGVSRIELRAAAERLIRLQLLKRDKNGVLRLSHKPGLATSHDVQSAALREAHKKVLQEAHEALEQIAVELRDITSITMAVDIKKLPRAKEKLKEFRRSLSAFLESGEQTEVYRLNIQLVPVTKRGK